MAVTSDQTLLRVAATGYEPKLLRRARVVAGLAYPCWYLLAPPGTYDPWSLWWAIGASFLLVAALPSWIPFVRDHLQGFFHACSWLVTLHFYVLAHVNDMLPFYAIGSVVAVVVVAGSMRTSSGLLAYSAFVVGLEVGLIALEPTWDRIVFWLPLTIVLWFYYYSLCSRTEALEIVRRHQDELEQRVEERTLELSQANAELRRGIQERALLEEQLRFSQKMEAVGRLAGGVAHDFNNMLTAIRGYGDLAREALPESHPVRGDLQQIQAAANQAGELTRQLLTLSRQNVETTSVLDLNALIRTMLPMLRTLMSEDMEVGSTLAHKAVHVRANRGQLEQVILNLALNARDAMPGGGKFTLETAVIRPTELESEELLTELPSGEYVLLAATDTGVGMDARTRSRVFEPFFTTKDVDKGTGMGLSTVYGVVKQGEGHVRVLSEPGRGARFELYFPRAAGAAEEVTPSAVPRERATGSGSILLVEDEGTVRRLARRVLERQGYAVLEAWDGEGALRVAAKHSGEIDLVLADVVLPRMSGFELADRLAPLLPDARLLFMSGYRNHPSLEAHPLPPGTRLLSKPFAPAELAGAVREEMDRRDGDGGRGATPRGSR